MAVGISRATAWVAAATLALAAAPASSAALDTSGTAAATETKIVYVDVGQGDGVIIKAGSRIIVSDAGESFAADEMAAALHKLGAEQIDVAILSHSHDDHIGGFEPLIEDFGFDIGLAVAAHNDHYQGTATNRSLLETLEEHDIPIRWVVAGDRFRWGGPSWRILSPRAGEFTADADAANASVVFLLTTHGRRLLFSGDIEEDASEGLIRRWASGRVDGFLTTHHGSRHGSPAALLAKIHPRFAVLSVGQNGFGHPTEEAVDRLEDVGATVWCTDFNGTVSATVSIVGQLTWKASDRQTAWSTPGGGRHGKCGARTGPGSSSGGGGGGTGAEARGRSLALRHPPRGSAPPGLLNLPGREFMNT